MNLARATRFIRHPGPLNSGAIRGFAVEGVVGRVGATLLGTGVDR